jgi:hypothetical protein
MVEIGLKKPRGRPMLKMIISGCLPGAGQGALDAAVKLGIPDGGWVPKGALTEDAPMGEAYHLKEMKTSSDDQCTEQNIIESNGTLIVSHGAYAQELKRVRKYAGEHNRSWMHIDLNRTPAFKAAQLIASWIREKKIEILNVTGPKAGEDPGIYQKTMAIIESVYHLSLIDENMGDLEKELAGRQSEPPRTVDEAVNRLILELPLKDRVGIANMTHDEISSLGPTLGQDIRFEFGLWGKNEFLMDSCRFVSGKKNLNPDDASKIIIESLWEKLRNTHKLRVVINGRSGKPE